MTETDAPGAKDAATISRFSASGQRLCRRPVAVVPITGFVDTSHPHNANDLIRLGEMKRFGKALFGGGKPPRRRNRITILLVSWKASEFSHSLGAFPSLGSCRRRPPPPRWTQSCPAKPPAGAPARFGAMPRSARQEFPPGDF